MKQSYHHGELRSSAIKKAIELIEEKREVSFTLREISTLLKVSHTALYRHFSSKHSLLVAIATEGFKELNRWFQEAKDAKTPKADSLKILGSSYIFFAYENQGQFRSMFHQELRCGSEGMPESFIVESEKCYAYLQDCIRTSKSEKFSKAGLEQATCSVWAVVHGFAQLLIDGQFPNLKTQAEIKKAIDAHLKLVST